MTKTSEPKVILKPKKNNSQIGCVAGLLPLIGVFLAIFAIHSAGNGIVQLLESLPWPLFILFTCGGMFICLKIFGSKWLLHTTFTGHPISEDDKWMKRD